MTTSSEIPFNYSFTDSTSTNYSSGYQPASTVEGMSYWLRCFDVPKIRKPYLPSLNTGYKAFYISPIILNPFLGCNFRIGGNKT